MKYKGTLLVVKDCHTALRFTVISSDWNWSRTMTATWS